MTTNVHALIVSSRGAAGIDLQLETSSRLSDFDGFQDAKVTQTLFDQQYVVNN